MKNRIACITGNQGLKAGALVILTLVMLIPLSMVKSLITERSYRAFEVKEEISMAAGGALQFAGPLIKVPAERRTERVYINDEGEKTVEYRNEAFSMWFSPEELGIRLELDTENKFRGIFYTPVFRGTVRLSGEFDTAGFGKAIEENEKMFPEQAEIIIPFFNQKGIRQVSEAELNGETLEFYPGNRELSFSSGGIYASAPLTGDRAGFNIEIMLSGADSISILPLASSTTAGITADWPAPSFSGLCLPDMHDIDDEGFSAVWNCSSLSSGLPLSWTNTTVIDSYQLSSSYIETNFINVHDHYEQNERAAKYAVLFILVPFITFFMFEHFFNRKIHIIQYIIAGTANIIFFLLLLSLSEHINFNLSYLSASAAVTLMMCLYVFSILKRDSKAWLMAPVMIAVYLFLFITLQSEDWALLIGSVGVFAITGTIMFVTRKIDFYQSRQNQR